MKWDKPLYLITETDGQDDVGNYKPIKTKRKVYANPFTVGRAEFSAAAQKGLKPEYSFQVNTIDYAGEEKAGYLGQEYDIYRTQQSGDKTTVYLTKRASNGRN
ncbi:hypothetical protein [Leuconostoc mesenteroides]|uniref:hypothetical protein n=1 Tax=Leuconostoc mesenteroides TaxID=1245 RepID=UPI00235F78F7|nr:hypothetical protein [Leuconostoc mesenteroides]